MYISVNDLLWCIVSILGISALIYLIVVLQKFSKVLSSINDLLLSNRKHIDKLCRNLPEISDNIKDVSEVITETTADVIVAKDNLLSNVEIIKDIMNIILSIFSKK